MGEARHFFETTGVCTVEIFSYRDGKLRYLETIKSPELTTPNDILGVGPRQFYVTIDHGWTSKWGKMLENYLQLLSRWHAAARQEPGGCEAVMFARFV